MSWSDRIAKRLGIGISGFVANLLKFVSIVSSDPYKLVQRTGGGKLKASGTLTEPAAVTVNGALVRVDANNQFEGSAAVSPGSNEFEVGATDGNGNSATQLYQVTVPTAAAVVLTYDFNGNIIESTTSSQPSTAYEWDAANRLTAISIGSHRTEIQYDGIGRRVRLTEKDSDVTTSEKRFLWCGNELCEERDAAGDRVTKRFFGQGEQRIGGSDAGVYFYARDHLGSVRELVDGSGAIRARYDYGIWGQRTKLVGDLDTDFGFTGHYFHEPSGLHLALYRAYDSGLGRWLSRDPIAENGGLNLYQYALSNPVRYRDPLGLNPDPYGFDEAETLGTMGSQRGIDIANAAPKIVQDTSRGGVTTVAMAVLPELGLFERLFSWLKLGRKCKATEAVVKDGYVDLGGFRFSEQYYQRLFDTGRGAPVTVAKEVLAAATSATVDRKAGFFRYEALGCEMVYNPTTREVWHLQPVK